MDAASTLGRSRFETELQVRPDDIDMYQHVHASRYIDYVLAARYEQMARCYGMSMEEFHQLRYGWVIREARLHYKRALRLGHRFLVCTWIEEMFRDGVLVRFEILRQPNRKICCDGDFHYTMIHLDNGRAAIIPEAIRARYSV